MFSERIDRLQGSLIREILALTQKPDIISFAGGLPATEAMPTVTYDSVPQSLRQYGTTEGEPELREQVAQQVSALGRRCSPDQVLITSGSQQGIDLVSKLFIDPGTPIALESPSYLAAIQSFKLFGARFLTLPLDEAGVDPAALRALIKRERPRFVYLIPTFQNPSGCCYSMERRAAIAAVLEETGVPLVEDEPYRELIYTTVERKPISAYLQDCPWIYLGSFSKTGTPGQRIGYVVASSEIHALLVKLKQATDLHTNRLGQWWAARFLADADYPEHLERLRARYRAQRDAMAASLSRHFPDLAQWQVPAGGLFFWLRLNRHDDTGSLLKNALAQKVAFMPGEPFFANRDDAYAALRLNFSHASAQAIEEGIARLAQVVRAGSGN